ncbi:hypothetical protein DFJ63DRAFT_81803 [Scheffersomyces coipomensis]|uniref:uncharacterized protein n=1 Tax=Scheffersomyces coipomensis TaxID=1788519 RepID=UPI00315D2F01
MSRRSGRSRYSEQPSEYPDNYEAEGEDDEEEDEEEEIPVQGNKLKSTKGQSNRGRGTAAASTAVAAEGDEEEDEVDEDEEQEITRCICGQDELTSISPQVADLLDKEYNITKIDQGLFIQCDKCSVWQHGYCVGLFINEDVPDKYWCELCKPDLHIFIYINATSNELIRTLYKPTNEKRKKLLAMEGHKVQARHHHHNHQHSQLPPPAVTTNDLDDSNNESGKTRSKNKRSSNEQSPQPSKASRKERRHYDDSYDEQLQKALRESAKESGIPVDSKRAASENATSSAALSSSNSVGKRRGAKSDDSDEAKQNIISKSEVESDQDPSNIEDDTESGTAKSFKRGKPRGRTAKTKKPRGSTPGPKSTNNNGNEGSGISAMTKEELINQPSKPRYVSEKSTVYELRKRTGAILEWLGRSQIELEEEKSNKIELFSYKEEIDINGNATQTGISIIESDDHDHVRTIVGTTSTTNTHEEDNKKLISTFNENLKLMEDLTEKILSWEQKYGKYAP